MNHGFFELVWFITKSRMTLDPPAVRLGEEAVEILARAIGGLDLLVVGGVVAVVARRLEDRHQPERVDAQVLEIVELRGEAGEVADAVAVGIGEAAHEDLVEYGSPRPVMVPLDGRGRGGPFRRCRGRNAGAGEGQEDGQEGEAEASGAAGCGSHMNIVGRC